MTDVTFATFTAASNSGAVALERGIAAEISGSKTLVEVLKGYQAFPASYAEEILTYVECMTAARRSQAASVNGVVVTVAPRPIARQRVDELRRVLELRDWTCNESFWTMAEVQGWARATIDAMARHVRKNVAKSDPMPDLATCNAAIDAAKPKRGGKGAAAAAAAVPATGTAAVPAVPAAAVPATISNAATIIAGLQDQVMALRTLFAASEGVTFLDGVSAALTSFLPYAAKAAAEKAAVVVPVPVVVPVVDDPAAALAKAKAEYDAAMARMAAAVPAVPAAVPMPIDPAAAAAMAAAMNLPKLKNKPRK